MIKCVVCRCDSISRLVRYIRVVVLSCNLYIFTFPYFRIPLSQHFCTVINGIYGMYIRYHTNTNTDTYLLVY